MAQMQVTLRAAVMAAFCGHEFFPELEIYDKNIGPLDLYQGSRRLDKLTVLVSRVLLGWCSNFNEQFMVFIKLRFV